MDPRYARNIPALTEAECAVLRNKRVLVVGCGGLGGHLIDLMARIGIGGILAVDGDVFEPSNLNRQLLSEVPLLGTGKAAAAAARVARVNPDVAVEAVETFLTEENAADLISGCDAVVDALDSIPARNALSRRASVQICDACGTQEALEDMMDSRTPLTEWAYIKMKEAVNNG